MYICFQSSAPGRFAGKSKAGLSLKLPAKNSCQSGLKNYLSKGPSERQLQTLLKH